MFRNKRVPSENYLFRENNSRGSTTDEHRPFERPELLFGQQIYHLEVGIDHESHVIVVVVDPNLLPLAIIQFAPTFHL